MTLSFVAKDLCRLALNPENNAKIKEKIQPKGSAINRKL